jgi:hypothetical protein
MELLRFRQTRNDYEALDFQTIRLTYAESKYFLINLHLLEFDA